MQKKQIDFLEEVKRLRASIIKRLVEDAMFRQSESKKEYYTNHYQNFSLTELVSYYYNLGYNLGLCDARNGGI